MELVKLGMPVVNSTNATEESALKDAMERLDKLVKSGALKSSAKDNIVDFELSKDKSKMTLYIDKNSVVDPAKLAFNGTNLMFSEGEVVIPVRTFSAATIQERLRVSGLDPRARMRFMIIDYKRYYKSKEDDIVDDKDLAKRFRNLFVLDMMGIFSSVLPYIQDGKQLATLTGLNAVAPGMNKIARDLSLAYRKALKQSKNGTISKTVYTNLQSKYKQFMDSLIDYLFPKVAEAVKGMGNDAVGFKQFSEVARTEVSGKVTIETPSVDIYEDLLNKIKNILDQGSDVLVKLSTDGNPDTSVHISKNDVIDSVSSVHRSSSEYKFKEDGRISIL